METKQAGRLPLWSKYSGHFSSPVHPALYTAALLAVALLSYAAIMWDIRISLWPHVQFFKLYGFAFTFVPGQGYVANSGAFVLSEGCVGAKLFVSAFLLITLGFRPRQHVLAFCVRAYLITLPGALFVSLLRIALSLPFCATPRAQLIHNILSLIIYFGSLCALYAWMQWRTEQKKNQKTPPGAKHNPAREN